MNYVTTNIRIPEDEYLRLKAEAALRRKSFASLIREKIGAERIARSKDEVEKLMKRARAIAKKNAKYTKGFDSVKALREIRYNEE